MSEKRKDNLIINIVKKAKKEGVYGNLYSTLGNIFNFEDIPFLREKKIYKFNNRFLLNRAGHCCVYFTSGTMSNPKAIYYDSKRLEHVSEYIKWICSVEGATNGERVVVLLGHSFWGAGYFTTQGHIRAGNTVAAIDMGLFQESIADLIKVFRPTLISSTPSFLMEMRKFLPETKLKIIETGGEPLSGPTRRALEEHFEAELFDAYGLTESIVGTECKEHNGYHFLPNKVFLEVVDKKSERVLGEEEWGELVITVLCDSVMPIVRYKTGDICKLSYKKCPCGLHYPRVWIKGRKEKTVYLHEGVNIKDEEIKKAVSGVLIKSELSAINILNLRDSTVIEVSLKKRDKVIEKKIKERVKNINYETNYLSQKGRLKVVFRKDGQ